MLTVFLELKTDVENTTNHWRIWPFHAIAGSEAMQSETTGADRTDCIIYTMGARVVFDTFICLLPDADQKGFVILVSRTDAWITYAIEYVQHRLKVYHGTTCTKSQMPHNTVCVHQKTEI